MQKSSLLAGSVLYDQPPTVISAPYYDLFYVQGQAVDCNTPLAVGNSTQMTGQFDPTYTGVVSVISVSGSYLQQGAIGTIQGGSKFAAALAYPDFGGCGGEEFSWIGTSN